FFSSRRRHTRLVSDWSFRRVLFRSELHLTENSRSQRAGLAAGKFDIVHSAVDNALAMIEVGKHDVVIVTGGDSGMNEFFVQPEKIGRASCRERGESWGGGESLKKKR